MCTGQPVARHLQVLDVQLLCLCVCVRDCVTVCVCVCVCE